MLVIRMQRTGRKGHAMFRVVVQDARQTPTSGKVVVRLGSFDPHTKATILDKEKAAFYLEHGAQPSDRVVRLLKAEGVKLPSWVKQPEDKERTVRNADKRRSTRPEEPVEEVVEAPAAEEAPAEEVVAEAPATETEEAAPAEEVAEVAEDVETPAEEPVVEEAASAEEPAAEAEEAPAETEVEAEKEA